MKIPTSVSNKDSLIITFSIVEKCLIALLALAFCLSMVCPAQANLLPAISFTGGSNPGSPPSGGATDGWRFSLSSRVTITDLGYFDAGGDGLAENHTVGIFTDAGVLLELATVTTNDPLIDGFRYHPILPLVLPPGTYRIGGFRTTGADSVRTNVTNMASSVSYLGGYFDTDADAFAFPDTAVASSYNPCVFGPNFRIPSRSILSVTGGSDPGSPPSGGATDGWRFSVNRPVAISHLGYYDAGGNGLAENHTVGIFTDAGVLLTSTAVTTSDPLIDSFRYHAIPTLVLDPGTYRIGGFRTTGADSVRTNVTISYMTSNPEISFLGGYFDTDADAFAFPDTAVASSYNPSVFGPGFLISSRNNLPVNTVAPSISGTATVYNTLTGSLGTWTDLDNEALVYTYQWYRSDDTSGTNETAIPSATSSNYILTVNDAHKYIRVTVTADDNFGSTPPSAGSTRTEVLNSVPVFTGTPAISGIAKAGGTLGLIDTGTSDADGDTVALSYQWAADGVNIFGAIFPTYTLTRAEEDKNITCTLVADDSYGGSTTYVTSSVFVKKFPWLLVVPGLVSPNKVIVDEN